MSILNDSKNIVFHKKAKYPQIECILKTLKSLYKSIKPALVYSKSHEFLFAVILSAQTTDVQVNKVTKKLFQKYKSLRDFANADITKLMEDISSIGLFRAKAKNIIASANLLQSKYNSKIPSTIEQLVELPGVGRKTANVVLSELFGINEGIAVDTHVKRLSQKYGLTKNTDPARIEKDLMAIIPKSEWEGLTLRMVQYGRDFCPANCKNCPRCPLWKCLL